MTHPQSHTDNNSQTTANPSETSLGRMLIICGLTLSIGLLGVRSLRQAYQMPYVGTLQATQTAIRSPQAGLIQNTPLSEGMKISPGTFIAKLSDSELDEKIEQQQRTVERLTSLVAQSRAQVEMDIAWRMKTVDQDIFVAKVDSSKRMRQLYLSEMQQMAWGDFLKSKNQVASTKLSPTIINSVISKTETPDDAYINAMLYHGAAENDVQVYKAQVELCKTRISELEGLKESLPERLRIAQGVELAEKNRDIAKDELEKLEALRGQFSITSKSYGRIGSLRVRVGDYVEEGETLGELWDYEKCYLETYIPSTDAHTFKVNQTVRLQFPGNKIVFGKVVHIPMKTIPASQLPLKSGVPETDTIVPIRVEPLDSVWPTMPIGTRVQVGLLPQK